MNLAFECSINIPCSFKSYLRHSRQPTARLDKIIIGYSLFLFLWKREKIVADITHSYDPVFQHFILRFFYGIPDLFLSEMSFINYLIYKIHQARSLRDQPFHVRQFQMAMRIDKSRANNAII